MMFLVLSSMLFAESAKALEPVEMVSVVEVNHYYDDGGKPIFDQIIFWEWCRDSRAFHVRDWRMSSGVIDGPIPEPHGDGWQVLIVVGGRPTRIRSRVRRETWTQYDPEMRDREFVPSHERKGWR